MIERFSTRTRIIFLRYVEMPDSTSQRARSSERAPSTNRRYALLSKFHYKPPLAFAFEMHENITIPLNLGHLLLWEGNM
jgi:hypothetical protein